MPSRRARLAPDPVAVYQARLEVADRQWWARHQAALRDQHRPVVAHQEIRVCTACQTATPYGPMHARWPCDWAFLLDADPRGRDPARYATLVATHRPIRTYRGWRVCAACQWEHPAGALHTSWPCDLGRRLRDVAGLPPEEG